MGEYNNHLCAIELKSVKLEDSGDWFCEMEEYYKGYHRGYGYNVTGTMTLEVIPKITTTTTLSSTTANSIKSKGGESNITSYFTLNLLIFIISSILIVIIIALALFLTLRNRRRAILFEILPQHYTKIPTIPKK